MADIDTLINRLDKLVAAMEKGSSGPPRPGQRRGRGRAADAKGRPGDFLDVKREASEVIPDLEDEIKVLENKERALGRLKPEQEAYLARMREELRLYKEMASAKSWEQYQRAADGLKEVAQAADDAAEAVNKFNQEFEAGKEKVDLAVNSMFQFGGAAAKLTRIIPQSSAELAGMRDNFKDLASTKKFFGESFDKMATKVAAESLNLAMGSDAAAASFRRLTGATNDGVGNYAMQISRVRNQTAIFGATNEDVGAAMGSLYTEMSSFTQVSEDQQDALIAQSVALDALGVSNSTTSQLFDQATKSLGFSEGQLVGLTEKLHDTAQSLGKSTQQVFQDFASVSKKLAFYGDDVVDVFQKLEKQSKVTGLSVDELVSISGKAFDTFDGAGQKVGRLNAILGGPYLNSIDMLNASEAERLEMLTDSVAMSGQLFSDMNKYEQLAIADALGVDVDTARRMFGELSAAEELQIRHQEEIAETAREAQDVIGKLKNAFMSLIVAMDVIIQPIAWMVEWLSKFIGLFSGDAWWQKGIKYMITATLTLLALAAAYKKVKAMKQSLMGGAGEEGGGGLMSRLMGGRGGEGDSPEEASGGFISWVERLMEAIKGSAKELLAFGGAMFLIGAGIAAAAFGLSYLVEAFQGLTGGQMVGAIVGMIVVFAGFAVAIMLLGKASLGAVGPMIALGVALLLMGVGIAVAAYGMSLLVASFAQLEGDQIWAAAAAIMVFSVAMVALVAVAVAASAAYPALLAVAAILAAVGLAAVLMGTGISIAAKGLAVLVAQLAQIPPAQIVAIAGAIYTLGMSLITLGAGAVVAAVGLGVLAVALLLAAYPLIVGSGALYIFGGALMLVSTGMTLVAVGAASLKASILAFVTVLPQVLEFAAALRQIGGAALGILATAAAMAALTLSLGPFGIALLTLNRKKLEALTEFNKSATLTVNNVQKPGVPTEAIKATETRMESVTSPGGSTRSTTVSKPVINFSPKSIVVKIGDTELKDIVAKVLEEQVSFSNR